jgi:hypothetical protein
MLAKFVELAAARLALADGRKQIAVGPIRAHAGEESGYCRQPSLQKGERRVAAAAARPIEFISRSAVKRLSVGSTRPLAVVRRRGVEPAPRKSAA